MNISKNFIEALTSLAVDMTDSFAHLSSTKKIEELARLGEMGQNVKLFINEKWCYSFQPREELEKAIPPEETEAERKLNKLKKEKNDFRDLYYIRYEDVLKKRLPAEQFEMIKYIARHALNTNNPDESTAGNLLVSKVYYAFSNREENSVMQATEAYEIIAKTAEERLSHPAIYFVAKSKVASVYQYAMKKDIAEVYGKEAAENYAEILGQIVAQHEKNLLKAGVQMGEGGPSNS